jgi:hypothetical protein
MPRNLEGAKAWRAAQVRPYLRSAEQEGEKVVPMSPAAAIEEPLSTPPREGLKLLKAETGEDLGAIVQWLRDLVKSYWQATQTALEKGDVARADALSRQLQSLTRSLAATERTWKQMEEKYGGLVSRATMIRFWILYKKSIDRCVLELPDSRQKAELIQRLDQITLQFSADLKLKEAIA